MDLLLIPVSGAMWSWSAYSACQGPPWLPGDRNVKYDLWYSTVLWVYWIIGSSWKKKAHSTDLILVLILFRTSRNLFQTLAKFVLCTKYLFTFHSFWSFLISSLFSQGAGCRVILVLRSYRGACTRQDLKSELKCLDYFLVGIINTVYNFKRNTTLTTTTVPSNRFSSWSNLIRGWKRLTLTLIQAYGPSWWLIVGRAAHYNAWSDWVRC